VTVDEQDGLAQRFEADRPHLRAVAYRVLGSITEAEDAVQEAWLRLQRSDTAAVDNLTGWLTTVVGRVCLDMLRARRSRREESIETQVSEPVDVVDPEHEAVLADSVGLALLVVLDALTPAERLAFVLHDMFAVPFDEIATIVGCSSPAARQLASRARRRVQGSTPDQRTGGNRQREIVDAFLAASRGGEFDALLALLDPDVVVRADAAAVAFGAAAEVVGAHAVAETFSGRARAARLALIDGAAGAVWTQGGKPRVVFAFTVVGAKVVGIEMLADPDRLAALDLVTLDA
jgi:RNA polymerase sigma-70 factor (ECF subfamily)